MTPTGLPRAADVAEPASMCIEVHWLPLKASPEELLRAADVVTPQERVRASHFRREADREAFILRRAFLRELLAERLGLRAADVQVRQGVCGKPWLEGAGLGFSLAKSLGLAVVVLAPGREVGCDIEWRRPGVDHAAVAELVFSERELAALCATPEAERAEAFFNGWTRKEAFVKAIGLGLTYPLKSFDVSLAPGDPPALLNGPPGWTLAASEPISGLHFAVCVSEE
jgi:4'-phosphopantetheinyl transferase